MELPSADTKMFDIAKVFVLVI